MATQVVHPSHWQYGRFPTSKNANHQIHSTKNSVIINSEPIFISWNFPPRGRIKINTDGSFMPSSRLAGFGGVARDDKGNWLGGFYGRLSMKATSSLTAELWAIHGGLILAKKYNMEKVIIETDSLVAVMLLTVGGKNVDESHPDRVVMEECRSLISELGVTLIHTLREGNNCADHLAKLGRMQKEELVVIQRPPYSMQRLLHADMAHVAYPRYPKHCNLTTDRTSIV